MKRFVKLVKNLFPGEKNGKETGKMFYIVVKDAERISTMNQALKVNLYLKKRFGSSILPLATNDKDKILEIESQNKTTINFKGFTTFLPDPHMATLIK